MLLFESYFPVWLRLNEREERHEKANTIMFLSSRQKTRRSFDVKTLAAAGRCPSRASEQRHLGSLHLLVSAEQGYFPLELISASI